MDVSPTGPLVRSSTERDHFRSSLIASSTTRYLSCRSWGLMSDSLRGLTSGDLLMPLRPRAGRCAREEVGEKGEGDAGEEPIRGRARAPQGQVPPQGRRSCPARLAPRQPRQPRRRVPSPAPAPGAPGRRRSGRAVRERTPETSRAAPPRAAPPRAPGCKGPPAPPAPPAPKPGRYSHGDALAPGCAAGKLSDPHGHRQRGAGRAQT